MYKFTINISKLDPKDVEISNNTLKEKINEDIKPSKSLCNLIDKIVSKMNVSINTVKEIKKDSDSNKSENPDGVYNAERNEIKIKELINKEMEKLTLLHELLHAISISGKLYNNYGNMVYSTEEIATNLTILYLIDKKIIAFSDYAVNFCKISIYTEVVNLLSNYTVELATDKDYRSDLFNLIELIVTRKSNYTISEINKIMVKK